MVERTTRDGRRFRIYLPVTLLVSFTVFPVYWLINSSLKGPTELFSFPPRYWPRIPTFINYTQALFGTRLGQLYLNSLVVSGCSCLAVIILAVFAGFAMARFRFRARAIVIVLFLTSQVIPQVVLLVPAFTMFKFAGLVNTRVALVLVYVVTWLPFSVMTMRGFYGAIPIELEEAAMIDGCTHLGALLRVVLPLALPGIVATAIYAFINAWNELLFAVVLISSPDLQTLPVGLMSLTDETHTNYGVMLSIAVLALIPSLGLFGWIQRYLTTGLSAGAVKG